MKIFQIEKKGRHTCSSMSSLLTKTATVTSKTIIKPFEIDITSNIEQGCDEDD